MLLWKRAELTKHRKVLGIGTTYYSGVRWVMYADGELDISNQYTTEKQIGDPNDWNDNWNNLVTKVSIRGRITGQGNANHNCGNWLNTFPNVFDLYTSEYFGRSITTNSSGIGKFSKWYYDGSLEDWCTTRDNRHQNSFLATREYDLYLNGTLLSGDVVLPKGGGSGVLAYVKNIDSVTFASGVSSIGQDTFYNTVADTVTVTESFKSIGTASFRNAKITNIIMPSEITSVGQTAFASSTISVIDFSNSVSVPTLGSQAFVHAVGNYSILVPDDLYDDWVAAWSSVASHIHKKGGT